MVKILTVRFGENLRIGMIQGEGTLNCEKVAGSLPCSGLSLKPEELNTIGHEKKQTTKKRNIKIRVIKRKGPIKSLVNLKSESDCAQYT